jgi:hypothetical protein
MSQIEIWQPRWYDRVVLIARHKVGGRNYITFTQAPTLPGTYYVAGDEVRTHKLESNGKIPCYAVPLDKLHKIDDNQSQTKLFKEEP